MGKSVALFVLGCLMVFSSAPSLRAGGPSNTAKLQQEVWWLSLLQLLIDQQQQTEAQQKQADAAQKVAAAQQEQANLQAEQNRMAQERLAQQQQAQEQAMRQQEFNYRKSRLLSLIDRPQLLPSAHRQRHLASSQDGQPLSE